MTASLDLCGEESVLRQCLEWICPDLCPPGVEIVQVHREEADCATSYHVSVLTVRLSTAEVFRLFVKDFSFSRLPKDGLRPRAERELCVYRDLLAEAGLGTARYYGPASPEAEERRVLVLELVKGERVRDCALEGWVAAARWLGQMQAYFAQHPARWQACGMLLRHDADFFWARAEGAVRAVSQAAPWLADRLVKIVDGYGPFVEIMTSQPRVLVHGSYRPQNILVDPAAGRVCPVDWELAAVGAPLYDLAFISDGFQPPERDRLWHAYLEAGGAYRPARGWEGMRYVIDCFRLHKVLKSLSEAHEKSFPEATIARLVGQAEGLDRLLAQGACGEEEYLE
jgi:hypothetical protein